MRHPIRSGDAFGGRAVTQQKTALLIKEGHQIEEDFSVDGGADLTDFTMRVNHIPGLTLQENTITFPPGIYTATLCLWMQRNEDQNTDQNLFIYSYGLQLGKADSKKSFKALGDSRAVFSHHQLEASFILDTIVQGESFDWSIKLISSNGRGTANVFGSVGELIHSYLLINKIG